MGWTTSDLNEYIEENENKQDCANLDNVRVSVFSRKKVIAMTATVAKPIVGKLLTTSTNMTLKGKRRDRQDVSMRKI